MKSETELKLTAEFIMKSINKQQTEWKLNQFALID